MLAMATLRWATVLLLLVANSLSAVIARSPVCLLSA
jgi:hypothetical protein